MKASIPKSKRPLPKRKPVGLRSKPDGKCAWDRLPFVGKDHSKSSSNWDVPLTGGFFGGIEVGRIAGRMFLKYLRDERENPTRLGSSSLRSVLASMDAKVTTTDEEGNEVEVEETYTVAIPVTDMNEVYARIEAAMGITVTPENQSNADSIYNIVLYGTATGTGDWFPGADVPFISVDGFCSPVGANWESIVTSEFGYRRDPFTGETRGHSGMDLAVPTGTPIRAALPGTVTVSQYNAGGYGYYVMIDHGNGLSTLYGHNSRLLAQVGQTVEAGDIIALSGSTGRSTGPHLHFEVRVDGEQTDPRAYLPTAGG